MSLFCSDTCCLLLQALTWMSSVSTATFLGISTSGHLEVIQAQLTSQPELVQDPARSPLSRVMEQKLSQAFTRDPPRMFSEEYQKALLENYHSVLIRNERIRLESHLNFADFMTNQSPTRVIGNKKGIFTRQMQIFSAFTLRERAWRIANEDQRPCPSAE
ncbi:Beta-glucuronidase [Apodemus speciosus]|uniref:Beta-glucuronidase n=1 Tax=Apodemus speciosus TaxID=105296 RepID=A0ABQ0ET59_APOSI